MHSANTHHPNSVRKPRTRQNRKDEADPRQCEGSARRRALYRNLRKGGFSRIVT